MQRKAVFLRLILLILFFFLINKVIASTSGGSFNNLFPKKTVYFGINMGGGSTEWKYLVDTIDPSDVSVTTPTHVTEGGPSWGAVLGYDVSKNFAIELQYMQFANAYVQFSAYSPYPVNSMVSKTSAYSLSGKYLAQIATLPLRAFAAVGAGIVKRSDVIYTGDCVTPYLSSGLVYNITRHWMLESGFQYYTGFGASELKPVNNYIPFAWDAYARIAYQ